MSRKVCMENSVNMKKIRSFTNNLNKDRSQWPRVLKGRPTAARLLRSLVRNPPGSWIFVCYECFVLSGRSLCDEMVTRPEESYRLWCVVVCGVETSRMKRMLGRFGPQRQGGGGGGELNKPLFIFISGVSKNVCIKYWI